MWPLMESLSLKYTCLLIVSSLLCNHTDSTRFLRGLDQGDDLYVWTTFIFTAGPKGKCWQTQHNRSLQKPHVRKLLSWAVLFLSCLLWQNVSGGTNHSSIIYIYCTATLPTSTCIFWWNDKWLCTWTYHIWTILSQVSFENSIPYYTKPNRICFN